MSQTRRNFGRAFLAALPASRLLQADDLKIRGVQLGVCTYSFRELPRPDSGDGVGVVLDAMKACRATQCELFSPQLEPADPALTAFLKQAAASQDQKAMAAAYRKMQTGPEARKRREELRQWRLATPAAHFKAVRQRFDQAGVDPFAYTVNFREDFTDPEIDKCFQQAQAMNIKIIAASTQLSVAPRLAPFADKYKIYLALHGHSSKNDPNEFSTPETFAKGLSYSKYFRINLDIGHFSAAGFDPVAYIQLHIKDRKKDDGPNEPFGDGDTPIKPTLTLLKDQHYSIPAFVEYEYKGSGTPVEEVNKCLAYLKQALA